VLNYADYCQPVLIIYALLSFASAFYLISLALLKLPVSSVYPVWAGGGTAGVALLGIIILKEQKNVLKLIGITMVVTGIVMLNIA